MMKESIGLKKMLNIWRSCQSLLSRSLIAQSNLRGSLKDVLLIMMGFSIICYFLIRMDYERGTERVNDGLCDVVAFGKAAIANPDLVQRFKNGWPLNQWKIENFFEGGEVGYNDYPLYE